MNVKRVRRLYNLKGLQMRHKPPRRRIMAKLRSDRSDATGPNQVWATDWMHDELFKTVGSYGCRYLEPSLSGHADLSISDGDGGLSMRWSKRDGSMVFPKAIRVDQGSQFRGRNLISGRTPMASRWTSVVRASQPTTHTSTASTPPSFGVPRPGSGSSI